MFLKTFSHGKETKLVNVELAQEIVLSPDKIELLFPGGDRRSVLGVGIFPAFTALESLGIEVESIRQAALAIAAGRIQNSIGHIPGTQVEIGQGCVRVHLPERPADFDALYNKWCQFVPVEFF